MVWGYGIVRSGLGYGQVVDTRDCGNKSSVCIKCEKILHYLNTDYILKNSVPRGNYVR